MPTYRLTAPGQKHELVEAESARREGLHLVIRGTAHVMGQPREVVLHRVPASVVVELVEEPDKRVELVPRCGEPIVVTYTHCGTRPVLKAPKADAASASD